MILPPEGSEAIQVQADGEKLEKKPGRFEGEFDHDNCDGAALNLEVSDSCYPDTTESWRCESA